MSHNKKSRDLFPALCLGITFISTQRTICDTGELTQAGHMKEKCLTCYTIFLEPDEFLLALFYHMGDSFSGSQNDTK